MFSAPKMDLVFGTLKGVKLRQRRALCHAPGLTANAMEETSIKKQVHLIPSSSRPIVFFQNNNKKTLGHAEYAHKHHTECISINCVFL